MTEPVIAVVGASTAGLAAARSLRAGGYDGRVVLIGEEPHRPYDRPPLIKQFLTGEWDAERLAFPDADDPALDVEWTLGVRAVGLDAHTRTLELDDGRSLVCDGIVLACGSRARRFPGTEAITGIHVVRSVEDAAALRAELDATPERVVVVGAGFIGCEVAATCRARGLAVTLVDPLDVPLQRVFGQRIGAVFTDLHTGEGVDVRMGVGVDGFETDAEERVRAVRLSDGSEVVAPVVVVGIGARPVTDWLAGSGLDLDDGVVCDARCTAAPGIVAAGDVLRWPNPVFGDESMRVEHWDHAFESAEYAASALLDPDGVEPFGPVPWFWSDQYDRKIQLAGRIRPDDTMVVAQGSLEERRFVALFERAGKLVGVVGMNRPRHVIGLRPKIADGIGFAEAMEIVSPTS